MVIDLKKRRGFYSATVTSHGASREFDNKWGKWQSRGRVRHDAHPKIKALLDEAMRERADLNS